MKVLASLRKQTKSGISTWTFVHDAEMKVFYAVGGEDLKLIPANDRGHLREIYNNFIGYGYTRKLSHATPCKQKLADPWQSELPLELQHELAAL
ncbi:MAG: hypothetical protein CML73_02350 [Rhodobiaceae bacterium]|nr:hypothetical protein [Rhodobiaceae bacterium]